MNLTVVLTAHNQVRFTALALSSLRAHYPDVPVVVVDHASTDETETYVGRHVKLKRHISYIKWEGERNLAHCWNLGVDAAKTRTVVVSNNDVVFTKGCLDELCAAAEHPHVGVALPQDNNYSLKGDIVPSHLRRAGEYLRKSIDAYSPLNHAPTDFQAALEAWWPQLAPLGKTTLITEPFYPAGGFCFAVEKDKWRSLDGFASRRYKYYGEDWDFFARATRRYKIVRADGALVWHFDKGTSKALVSDGERFDLLMASRFQLTEDHEGKREIVSIVIPVKDRPRELQEALRSVSSQTFKDWRCYVINDASTDWRGVSSVCESFNDPRIGMWELPENRGPSAARNHGIDRARGKYIAFLDSDDVWMPHHLAEHVAAHEKSFVDLTYSDARFQWRWWDNVSGRFLSKEGEMKSIDYYGPFDKNLLVEKNYILTSASVWWAPTVKALRFDETMRFEEDWDLCKRLDGEAQHIGVKTVVYCQQPESPGLMTKNLPGFFVAPSKPDTRPIVEASAPLQSPFTVVIPTKDRPVELDRALRSVGPVCAVVVVDDGSSKLEAVTEVCRRFSNVSLYRNNGKGCSSARNLGVAVAKSPWVKFLDDDDVLCNGWLMIHERQYMDCDLFTVDCVYPDHGGMSIGGSDCVCTSQVAFKVGAFQSIGGFDPEKTWKEEQDLLDRAFVAGLVRTHVPGPSVVKSRISARPVNGMRRLPSGDYV